jgi:hypothetical protein
MNIVSGIVVYVLIWWWVIFCMLPLNITPIKDNRDGSMPGAPVEHGMKRKVILTSIISFGIWVVIYLIIKSNIISYHDIAQKMNM